jgi:hypothetical protein
MPARGSVVPAVVDAVVAVASAAAAGWQVFDGPNTVADVATDVLLIGVGNDEDADPYRVSRGVSDLGGRSMQTVTIRCQASTWSGDPDLSPLRHHLAGMMADVEAALRADPQMDSVVATVRLGSERWYHLERDVAGVGVHFDVIAMVFA